jgi:hypothetical protein
MNKEECDVPYSFKVRLPLCVRTPPFLGFGL